MDGGRLLYRLLQGYVLLLFALGIGTAAWVLAPRVVGSPQVAGLWFGLGGFGLLLLTTLVIIQFGTDLG